MISTPAPAARRAMLLLTLAYVLAFVDRQLIGILGQPIKAELKLGDAQLGLLGGLAFALFYTALGIPIARLAERRSRVTIVAAALAIWSGMTALCGLATGFPQLFLARIGVGVGEAGCAAPAQSLIADLHPPERRATALGLFSLGVPVGMLVGAVAGGWLAQTLGWRAAFVLLGLPGLLLALVIRRSVVEPPRAAATAAPPLAEVLWTLLADRAFRHMAAGATLASFAGYGLTQFGVPLLVRSFPLTLATAASGFGIVVGLAVGIGIGGGGWLSDRLRARYAGAPGLVAGAGMIVAAALFEVALIQTSPRALAGAAFVPLAAAHLYFGPTYGVTIEAVGPRMRATAIALLLLVMNGIGLSFGPLTVGWLSDRFAEAAATPVGASAYGLRQALRVDALIYLWAAGHFLYAARLLRAQPQRMAR